MPDAAGNRWSDDAMMLADDPRGLFGNARSMFAVPYDDVVALQVEALNYRVAELRRGVPIMRRLDPPLGLTAPDDIVPYLLPSGVYKAYQFDWLIDGRFKPLTNWLQQLSVHDLSAVDLEGCASVDEWLDRLEEQSPLRVCHSSATSGKLSFIPRTEREWVRRARTMPFANEAAGVQDGPDTVSFAGLPIISPFYRTGHSTFLMSVDWNVRVHGNPDDVLTLYPGRLSSDLMVLAGRLRSHDLNDGVTSTQIPPSLAARTDELQALLQGESDAPMADFVKRASRRFGGQRVWVIGGWPNLVDAARVAVDAGITSAFAPDSVVHAGGGTKGRDLGDDWYGDVCRWLGMPAIDDTYGMSEVMGMMARCSAGKYHPNPWQMPFVLDVTTLAPRPRTGVQTGRFACVDLMAETYWGGFVSSDLVTLTWEPRCECGREGPRLDTQIARVEEVDGEKVSCAATPDAHDEAMTFLRSVGA